MAGESANQTYNFHNCQGLCLIGQFMAFDGVAWDDKRYDEISNREVGPDIEMWEIAINHPHTFGAALTRARAIALDNQRIPVR